MSDPAGSDGGPRTATAVPSEIPGPARSVEADDPGLRPGRGADPCVMVIFGASGDLTRRSLLPSLFELHCKGLLPERFALLGTARTEWDSDRFRSLARESARQECAWHESEWDSFARRLHYLPTDAGGDPAEDYAALGRETARLRQDLGIPDNVFFHLAVPPAVFGTIAGRLGASGLASSSEGWRRLVVEKPFGEDRESAEALDEELRRVFDERQIYRIDHFLGKETVQNMLVFRLANPGWEPIWNRNYIDHVQITVAEDIGIGTRAGFYERTGVVRDMVQNHLLQLLCMAAMEPPLRFDGPSLRDETVKVLRAVNHRPVELEHDVVLGQYGPGEVGGEPAAAYREEEGVAPDSSTPTFVALKLTVDNWRWAGVPFYLRTGKRMARKLTEVAIQFKPTPHAMFPHREDGPPGHNMLAFRLQPDEGIVRTFLAKQPGPEIVMREVTMNFRYADAFGVEEPPRAYAWLLLDVMQGNPTLFARADWIREAWNIVDPIVGSHEAATASAPHEYPAGSWGPPDAWTLLEKDGRGWRHADEERES